MAERPDYDPDFTARVIAATGEGANPRLAQIMPSLLRHLHDFAREVDLTVAEWTAGVELINQAGRMSDDKRNETQLICDILGLESLVDEITSKKHLVSKPSTTSLSSVRSFASTPSAVLGPFYRNSAPVLKRGSSIVSESPTSPEWNVDAASRLTRVSGRVVSADTGEPIEGAIVDVWHAGPNGLYEQQDADVQPEMNLRGRFTTDAEGRYELICLRPTPYPIPYDGPAGKLLQLLDRHPYRPAHIHFIVTAPEDGSEGGESPNHVGYRPLTTQIFDREDPRIYDDAVFAVKDELLVDFKEVAQVESSNDDADGNQKKEVGLGQPSGELDYDFKLSVI